MHSERDARRLRRLRLILLIAVCIWSWYFVTAFRTSGWGYDDVSRELVRSWAIFCVFALPFAFIPLIGVEWRLKGIFIAVLAVFCILGAELFGRSQEYLLIRKLGEVPIGDHMENRWWPFTHHHIGYLRGDWWGCD
jgi:hypothetical protein